MFLAYRRWKVQDTHALLPSVSTSSRHASFLLEEFQKGAYVREVVNDKLDPS